VCCGGKVSSHGGYKKACSSLCSFVFCSSSHSLFIHLVSLLLLSKSFITVHDSIISIVSLITFLYPNCSYQLKFGIARSVESIFAAHNLIVLNIHQVVCRTLEKPTRGSFPHKINIIYTKYIFHQVGYPRRINNSCA